MISVGDDLRRLLGLDKRSRKASRHDVGSAPARTDRSSGDVGLRGGSPRTTASVLENALNDIEGKSSPAVIPIRARSKAKPKIVERIEVEEAINGKSYEEANWARLSPAFRNTHNHLRQLRGMSPIPPPKVDLYVKPRVQKPKQVDLNSPEMKAAAAEFMRMPLKAPGNEGFTINGEPADFEERDAALRRSMGQRPKPRREGPSEGFRINGRTVR